MTPEPKRAARDAAVLVGAALIVVSWLALLGWGGLKLAGAL
jgi:hypothetical protein